MSGRHPFQELSREFTAERRQRIDAIKHELISPSEDKAPPFPIGARKAGKNAQNIPDDTAPRNPVAVRMSGNATANGRTDSPGNS